MSPCLMSPCLMSPRRMSPRRIRRIRTGWYQTGQHRIRQTRTNWTLANRTGPNRTGPNRTGPNRTGPGQHRLTLTGMAASAPCQPPHPSQRHPGWSAPHYRSPRHCRQQLHHRQRLYHQQPPRRWPRAAHRPTALYRTPVHPTTVRPTPLHPTTVHPTTKQPTLARLQERRPQAVRLAGLPLGESAVPGCWPGCCRLRLTRIFLWHRSFRSGHQLTLCSVARSRAFGRSLPSGSRAQPASPGRSAPRGNCSYALTGAVLAVLASPATRHVAITCPCSAPRESARGASAIVRASGAFTP